MSSYSPWADQRESLLEDLVCGFLGGATASFNTILWIFPSLHVMSVGQCIALSMTCGIIAGGFMGLAHVNGNSPNRNIFPSPALLAA